MRNYIILNGTNSNTINGLLIQSLAPISKPLMRTEIEQIDGRDGDIITPLGFSAYDKQITVGLYGDFDINAIIAFFNSEGTVTFSNEPDKYYNYQIYDQIDFERLVRYRTATVTFHVQPFKFGTTGETQTLDSGDPVTGEGSNIVLDGTAEALFNKLDPKGNASQKTTSGKNLSNIYAIDDISGWVTLTVANDKITISNNQNTAGYTNCGKKLSEVCPTLQVGDIVYVFFDTTSSSANRNGVYIGEWWGKGNSKTITQDMLDANLVFYGGYNETAVISNFMITKTNDSTYEQYCGGIPAPNPLYPFPVNVVTGEQEVRITGKNMFAGGNADYAGASAWLGYGNATYTLTDGAYYMPDRFGSIAFEYDHLVEGQQYTISFDVIANAEFSARVGVNVYNGSPTEGRVYYEYTAKTTSQRISWTFTAQAENRIAFNSGTTVGTNITISNIQLEKNNQATTYEAYQSQSYEIYLAPNIFDIDDVVAATGQTTLTMLSNGWRQETTSTGYGSKIQFSGLSPSTTYTLIWHLKTISGSANKYVRVFKGTAQTDAYATVSGFPDGKYSLTFTTDAGATQANIWFYNGIPAEGITEWTDVCLLAGAEGIELAKIPNTGYQDKPVKVGDTWYIRRMVGKVVLDGTEAIWGTYAYGTNSYQAVISGIAQTPYWVPLAVADRFYGIPYNDRATTAGECLLYADGGVANRLVVRNTPWASLSDFKTWLGTHPTTVYYALATPVDEEITDATLISQLEALQTAHAYRGRTHINAIATGDNLPHIIEAEVNGDASGTVTNAGNIYSKPKLTVYGSGNIGIYLNGVQMFQVALGSDGYITIDTNLMEAYKDNLQTLMNRQVIGDYDNFKLPIGESTISFSGTVTKCIVENYSRWL